MQDILSHRMKSLNGIKSGIAANASPHAISRKIYLSYPTAALTDKEDIEFEIKDAIADYFRVNFTSIQVCGSSKTGISFFKDSLFRQGDSDLDIAIVDPLLYKDYLEISHDVTNGFTDLSLFKPIKGDRSDLSFFKNLKKGFFNPSLMPNCDEKTKWFEFFLRLSQNYYRLFKNINAGIYLSEYFFESKQREGIDLYIDNIEKYDKISG